MAKKKTDSGGRRESVKGRFWLSLMVLVALFLVATWGWLRLTTSAPPGQAPAVVAPLPELELTLYFATPEGVLLAESRMLQDVEDELEKLRSVVTALIAGPTDPALLPVLPATARLLGVTLQESVAQLDFSREFVAAHPGGSVSELLTVYALVDTLAVNFPYVRQIRIQVEGDAVETIKGHADLRRPISVDFSYVDESDDASHADAVGDLIEKHGSGETQ